MEQEDRLKTYQGFAETSRKWVSVYDTKAGFVSAMNTALLAFIWTGAKFAAETGVIKYVALSATLLSITSLVQALLLVLPRIDLPAVFGKVASYESHYEPISFFGHVAGNYPVPEWERYREKVDSMDEQAFAMEALEQHFTISHTLKKKSACLSRASAALLAAILLTGFALLLKEVI